MEGNHIYSLISNVVPTPSGSPFPPTFPTVSATLGGQHQQRHISAFVHDHWAFPRVNDGTSTFERGELRRRVTRGAVQAGSSVVTGLQVVRQVRRHLLETRSARLQTRRRRAAPSPPRAPFYKTKHSVDEWRQTQLSPLKKKKSYLSRSRKTLPSLRRGKFLFMYKGDTRSKDCGI